MTAAHTAAAQYSTGLTRANVQRALAEAGLDIANLEAADLAPLEHFHSLGVLATGGLLALASVTSEDRVLDAGTGIGGTARMLAAQFGCRVSAVDLTPEYCETAAWLNDAVGLGEMIDVQQGDVTDLPFEARSFDVVISQHVQMNIADKARLYTEARRVLAPGGRLAIWDVTAGPEQPIRYPVPWADEPSVSHLVTPSELRRILLSCGFEIEAWNDLTEPALEPTRRFLAAPAGPLGLHVFVPDFRTKAANLVANGAENRTRLIQAVLRAA